MTALAKIAPTADEIVQSFPSAEQPVISLKSVFVSDETVSLCGSVSPELASNAELQINGYPIPITFSGSFAGVVTLGGAWNVEIALSVPTGERVVLRLPVAGL